MPVEGGCNASRKRSPSRRSELCPRHSQRLLLSAIRFLGISEFRLRTWSSFFFYPIAFRVGVHLPCQVARLVLLLSISSPNRPRRRLIKLSARLRQPHPSHLDGLYHLSDWTPKRRLSDDLTTMWITTNIIK